MINDPYSWCCAGMRWLSKHSDDCERQQKPPCLARDGKRCYDCGGEILYFKGGWICTSACPTYRASEQ